MEPRGESVEETPEAPCARVVTGNAAAPWLDDLARLRIEVFREFPYLYDGDFDYEQRYLATYAASPESLFVIATWKGKAVGLSTALPLVDAQISFQDPFREAGIDPGLVFYYGESVLQERWRGHGLGRRFMEERENYARSLGRFEWLAFCAVQRPDDHPARPEDYRDLHEFWTRCGFSPQSELVAELSWREIGELEESPKRMLFWLKKL